MQSAPTAPTSVPANEVVKCAPLMSLSLNNVPAYKYSPLHHNVVYSKEVNRTEIVPRMSIDLTKSKPVSQKIATAAAEKGVLSQVQVEGIEFSLDESEEAAQVAARYDW